MTVRVADNGIGISTDELSHLFDMFYQVDRSYDRAHGGLGIGLTLVKRLVEMHGGTVEAKVQVLVKEANLWFLCRCLSVRLRYNGQRCCGAEIQHAQANPCGR